MLCKLYLEHSDIGGGQYLKPASFLTLSNYIDKFDFVKVMSPKEFDLFEEEDWFGDSPYWEEFVEDLKNCDSIVIYGEDGGTSFDTIVQFNFNR